MDPLSLTASVVPLLSFAVQVLQTTVQFVSDVKEFPDEFRKLVERTQEMSNLLKSIRPVIEALEPAKEASINPYHSELMGETGILKVEQLEACHTSLRQIEDLLIDSIRRKKALFGNAIKSLTWPLKSKQKAKELLSELEIQKSAFVLAFAAKILYDSNAHMYFISPNQSLGNTNRLQRKWLKPQSKWLKMKNGVFIPFS
jgi:hypothetical protein